MLWWSLAYSLTSPFLVLLVLCTFLMMMMMMMWKWYGYVYKSTFYKTNTHTHIHTHRDLWSCCIHTSYCIFLSPCYYICVCVCTIRLLNCCCYTLSTSHTTEIFHLIPLLYIYFVIYISDCFIKILHSFTFAPKIFLFSLYIYIFIFRYNMNFDMK